MIKQDLKNLNIKPFEIFSNRWALVTAGNFENRNTMTISYGTLGTLWGKSVVMIFVRPTRYTYTQLEQEDRFTVSFMPEEYKEQMKICGKVSGRDCDKYKLSGLVPIYDNDSFVSYIKGANMVFKCKKIYAQDFNKDCFIESSLLSEYDINIKDFHRMYVGEITSLLVDEKSIEG